LRQTEGAEIAGPAGARIGDEDARLARLARGGLPQSSHRQVGDRVAVGGDRDDLVLAELDGVAGVVGPNGCGKSNLSDAISWVLGEQSARMMRGERMADVIFNGTSTRLPTGLAEVSLTLIDPDYVATSAPETDFPCDVATQLDACVRESPVPQPEAAESVIEIAASGSNGRGAESVTSRSALEQRSGEIVVTRRLFRSGESEYLVNGKICRLRDIQDLFMGTGLGPELSPIHI